LQRIAETVGLGRPGLVVEIGHDIADRAGAVDQTQLLAGVPKRALHLLGVDDDSLAVADADPPLEAEPCSFDAPVGEHDVTRAGVGDLDELPRGAGRVVVVNLGDAHLAGQQVVPVVDRARASCCDQGRNEDGTTDERKRPCAPLGGRGAEHPTMLWPEPSA